MLLDTQKPITQLDGTEVKNEEGAPVTCGAMIKQALLSEHLDAEGKPERTTGEEKFRRWQLAMKIENAGAIPADITVDDAKLIKELVGKTFTALVVGQIYTLIEHAPASPAAKPKAVK